MVFSSGGRRDWAGGGKGLTRKIETIENLVNLAFVLMKSKAKNKKNVGYKCGLTKVQVEWYVLLSLSFLVVR